MRALNNLKLLSKLAIPITVFVLVVAGLIFFAKASLDNMTQNTHSLVDVDAARVATLLQINAEVNEASIQEKNLILYTSSEAEKSKGAERNYQQYKAQALQHVDQLMVLADSANRRA